MAVVSHEHPAFQKIWNLQTPKRIANKHNGGYYYSREIVENIIPNVETDRNWVTVNLMEDQIGLDHAIVFVHNNLHAPEWYEWLKRYDDIILVCSKRDTQEAVAHIAPTIFLPLSVDVAEVERYRRPKDRDIAFAGRRARMKQKGAKPIPNGTEIIGNVDRDTFLSEMARYRRVYAVDRVAIEALILDCEVLLYEDQPAPVILDNKDAAKMLQVELDRLDRR